MHYSVDKSVLKFEFLVHTEGVSGEIKVESHDSKFWLNLVYRLEVCKTFRQETLLLFETR